MNGLQNAAWTAFVTIAFQLVKIQHGDPLSWFSASLFSVLVFFETWSMNMVWNYAHRRLSYKSAYE